MKKLWISAGELSGDIQGGALLAELRRLAPTLKVVGQGGDNLARAGQKNLFRVEELSVMGVTEVLGALPRILGLLWRIKKAMATERPDAVLLIDAPDFNFRVARMSYHLGIPVYYFIPPKVWAWRTGRVEFLKKYVRGIFSILPFELDFYRKHGMSVEYVGNPLVDLVDWENIKSIGPVSGRIGLMPGSRRKEVEKLLPAFAGAADILHHHFPNLEYHCVVAPNFQPDYVRSHWPSSLPLHLENPEHRYAFLRSCRCVLAASGTATLETGLAHVPTLVAYKVSPLSYWVGRHVIKASWISLTNLILGREAFPEHIQRDADPGPLAARLEQWLGDPSHFVRMERDMEELRELCGPPGSARHAAEAVWRVLKNF